MEEDIARKSDRLRRWRYEHPGEMYPDDLLPTYNDLLAFLDRDSNALRYFGELLVEMAAQIRTLQEEVKRLQAEEATDGN